MLSPSSLFQNGAVLQRDMELPVWGKAHPDTIVEVIFDGISSFGRSSSTGDFMVYLPPHSAGGPYELRIKSAGEELVFRDILVGEVWLCSGQSNMQYLLSSDRCAAGKSASGEETLGKRQEQQFNDLIMEPEKLRFFSVEHNITAARESTCHGQWYTMSKEHSGKASAVAAWFGLGLQYQLDVPIGLIISSLGGTPIEAWMSEEALCAIPETREMAAALHRNCCEKGADFWDINAPVPAPLADAPILIQPDSGNEGFSKGYADLKFDDTSWKEMKVSGSWKQQNIAGNGAVWFRKKITLPAEWENAPLELRGGSVDKHDITYFNNCEIGRTGSGVESKFHTAPRRYPINGASVKKGENLIAIRGFSYAYDGGVNGNWFLVNKNTDEKITLNGIWKAQAEYDRGNIVTPTPPPPQRANHSSAPAVLFNSMIAPLIPYGIKGVIWYQGENNASSVSRAQSYKNMQLQMIRDWRYKWRNPDLVFIMVQLAGYGTATSFSEDSSWAFLRESQRLTALEDPSAFMISAIDIGEEDDIHPQNKLDVGKRLAMSALHHAYKFEKITPSGPELMKAEREADTVRLTFRYGTELELRSAEESFFLAGKNGIFFPAAAVIEDGCVLVSSREVKDPVELRYAWSNFPPAVLFNKAGFPAPSFRIVFGKDL